jgi:uncharacterized membrane protein (UPF0127 family)
MMSSFIFIQNLNRAIRQPARVKYCDAFACRLRGLMFRADLPPAEGLLLVVGRDSLPDSSIHMLFVPFDLAVFWIDSGLSVVDKIVARSWRPAYFPARAARYTLELHSGRIEDYQIGDRVRFENA